MGDVKLADLIDDTERRNDWRDTKVAQQAKERGHNLTPSDISLYRHRGMRQLVPTKVQALAAGLRLPAYKVALAVLADLGIEMPLEARTPEDAVRNDHTLSAQTRDQLLLLIAHDRS